MKLTQEDKKYFDSRLKKAKTIVEELSDEGISSKKRIKVLEVGCNHGFITYHLAKLTKWNMFGGDTNKDNLKKYPFINDVVKLNYLDATKMKFESGKFDVVIYNHVIEHIPEWEKTIKEIYRILKKDGLLYLATPNLHRKFVHPKVGLSIKKNLDRDKRMRNHMGFSSSELRMLLKPFRKIKCINKKHFVSNTPAPVSKILKILPEKIHEKYAQTNVFIARK